MHIGFYTDVYPLHGGVSQYTGLVLEECAAWKERCPSDRMTLFAPASMQDMARVRGLSHLALEHQPTQQRAVAWMRANARVPAVRRTLQRLYSWHRSNHVSSGQVVDHRASAWIRDKGVDLLF